MQHYGATPKIFENAKALRQRSTSAEKQLWTLLRNRQLNGYKFRRQHPIDRFIADFYCHEANLVIELDGNIHELDEVKAYDAARQTKLESLGLTVLRFTNEDVFTACDEVMERIAKYLSCAHLCPLPKGEEAFPQAGG
jgi:very-short-patch-repair endonuclease